MSISTVLQELFKKYNINALELERITGVPSSTIYRLLKDSSVNPTIEVLKKLSSFFQITVSQLIGEEPLGCKHIPLVPSSDVFSFVTSNSPQSDNYNNISIDFPLNNKCFATFSKDSMMEPFILMNSVVIIDPERSVANKDFIIIIQKNDFCPIIRQVVFDGYDFYLKILNSNFPIELKKINLDSCSFVGVVVHYRTNLFDFCLDKNSLENRNLMYDKKK